jgi:tetratricopeptide (TPR) repeat protein
MQMAITLEPNYAVAHYQLGKLLKQQGKLDQAVAAYRTALGISPKDQQVHVALGQALFEQKQFTAASDAYRQALSLYDVFDSENPTLRVHTLAHNSLGLVLQAQGNLEGAIAEFKQAIASDANYAEAQTNLKQAEQLLAAKPAQR